jgi:hypothetical protein
MLDGGDHHAGAEQTRIQVAWLIQFFGPTQLITEITHENAQSLIRWRRPYGRQEESAADFGLCR